MKAIEDAITRLQAERDALSNRIEGLQAALRIVNGESVDIPVVGKSRQPRGGVKNTVLEMVTNSKDLGITVNECVSTAESEFGIKLDRGSVSSLLSRLKKDDVLFYDGERYRLKSYAGPRQAVA